MTPATIAAPLAMAVTDDRDADAAFARIVDELTRRGFLAGGLGSAALLGLAACGSADTSGAAESSRPRTRVVDTPNGPITIPVDPQRIVCIDNLSPLYLLDTGYTPVGAGTIDPVLARYQAAYQPIPKIDGSGQIGYEQIAALDPDLIVQMYDEAYDPVAPYDRLRPIAATVMIPIKSFTEWAPLEHQVTALANRDATLDKLVAQCQQSTTAVRSGHPRQLAGLRFAVVTGGSAGTFSVALPDSSIGVPLQALGIQFSRAAAGKTGQFLSLSLERMDVLSDADVVLLDGDAAGQIATRTRPVTQNKLFAALPAVRAGKSFALRNFNAASYGGVLDLNAEISTILTRL